MFEKVWDKGVMAMAGGVPRAPGKAALFVGLTFL